jgi:type IV pilus assembly protein PilA
MFARIRKAQENEGGFTLIELLVVMIIIGILAAIAIPAFLSQKNKGYEASEKSDLRSIATEISTQLVDQPTAVTVTAGNATSTSGAGPVWITADSATPGKIALSSGNQLVSGSVTPETGVYCVELKSTKGGANWRIEKTAADGAQNLVKGSCTVTP